MTVLTDRRLKEARPVSPFLEKLEDENVISWGLSSCGIDLRLGYTFKLFNPAGGILDPKNPDPECFIETEVKSGGTFILPPFSYCLAYTIEIFKIPYELFCLIIGKSTYARSGIIINCTPAEPGWEGHLTIEISNPTPLHVILYPGEGILQAIFFDLKEEPLTTYDKRNGKYQNQGPEPMASTLLTPVVDWGDLSEAPNHIKVAIIKVLSLFRQSSSGWSLGARDVPSNLDKELSVCMMHELVDTDSGGNRFYLTDRGEELSSNVISVDT